MTHYTIGLDETISEFYEEIAIIAKRPVEEILSDALFRQVEMIKKEILGSLTMNEG